MDGWESVLNESEGGFGTFSVGVMKFGKRTYRTKKYPDIVHSVVLRFEIEAAVTIIHCSSKLSGQGDARDNL